jgi:hypothetical protein
MRARGEVFLQHAHEIPDIPVERVMPRMAFCSSRILASSKKPKLLKSVLGDGYVFPQPSRDKACRKTDELVPRGTSCLNTFGMGIGDLRIIPNALGVTTLKLVKLSPFTFLFGVRRWFPSIGALFF